MTKPIRQRIDTVVTNQEQNTTVASLIEQLRNSDRLKRLSAPGTRDEKWRRRESNPQVQSRNSEVARRLWQLLQSVGVSWEWKDDANWQRMALGQEELAELITAWPLLSPDLRQAILTIGRQ